MEAVVRRILYFLIVATAVEAALGGWSYFIEPSMLKLRRVEAVTPKWPADRPPLRIAVIADIHEGVPQVGIKKVAELVRRTNAEKPDLVLLAGDFVATGVVLGRNGNPEAVAAELKKLTAPLGVFAVLGNHDWVLDGRRVRRALEGAGITVLENAQAIAGTGGQRIVIAGIADDTTRAPDVAKALAGRPDGVPVIALAHDPATFADVPASVVVTIAGHTHGGQVNIPLIGPLVNASRAPLRHSYGLIREAGRLLYVSGGIGTSILPIRFNRPPEFTILTIRHGNPPPTK
jgi:predicted MPP superfamily phosphohydrolase